MVKMSNEVVITNRGEAFRLTEEELKVFKALKRLEKMDFGRLSLFGNGSLSIRINGHWNNDEFYIFNIFCEGGDGGDNC